MGSYGETKIMKFVILTESNCQWLSRVDNLDKDRHLRKSWSKVTNDMYSTVYRLSVEGLTSSQIGGIV